VHICAQQSVAHSSVLEEVEGYKNNFVFFSGFLIQVFNRWKGRNIILFLSQGSWCKLYLDLASELCQPVADELFIYLSYLFRSWQNTRFAK
jgi:hypothetical protein